MKKIPFLQIDNSNISRPYIFVTVMNPENSKSLSIYALIDTGADECCFPIEYAQILGHDFKKGNSKKIMSANGISEVYSHTNRIYIEGYMTKDILIDFSETLKTPLLGVRNFLCDFILTVNYPQKYFILEQ